MKINALILGMIAASSTAMANEPLKMQQGCETAIRSSVAVEKLELEAVTVENVRVLVSSCQGPADCDAQNPDTFTYAADLGKKVQGLSGQVVVHYHRGNCFVKKITLFQ